MALEQDAHPMAREDLADLGLDELVIAGRDEQMSDRETAVVDDRRVQARGAERIRPELAGDVGEDPRTVPFAVDGSGAMGEAFQPPDGLGKHLAGRRAVLARDRHQCTGVALVVHG